MTETDGIEGLDAAAAGLAQADEGFARVLRCANCIESMFLIHMIGQVQGLRRAVENALRAERAKLAAEHEEVVQ